jgi:CubicO group peptidase (beta-lactamase class C family)
MHLPEFADLRVYAGTDDEGEPILEAPRREVTIRDITRHTAGFANSGDIPGVGPLWDAADAMNPNNSLDEFARRLGSLPLWHHPGEQWAYGPSVDVQAALVERLSGIPFEQFVREKVLVPLRMMETSYLVPEESRSRLAKMYYRQENGDLERIPDQHGLSQATMPKTLNTGGFGLSSTLDDYSRFARMLLNGGELDGVRILQPETVRLMATNHLSDDVTERSWLPSKEQVGFGIDFAVRLRPPATADENNGAVGEFFWDGAASTLFWVDPVNELVAVLFTQLMPFDQIGLHKAFRDAVYGQAMLSDGRD